MPPTLYLIDGHALAYRTYFAMTATSGDSLRTSTGEPTAAIFGFMSVLFRLLEKEKPEYLAVAFDTGRTFRNDIFPEYKATRAKMPDELRGQIERLRSIIDAFDIPRLEKENAEADDVLGTIALQAVEKGLGVKIITGDRDLLQLVTERILVNLPGRSMADAKDYGVNDVIVKMGVSPDKVIELKALMGDSSDNIPGVPGIGEKSALNLLGTFNSIEEIYDHLEDVPQKFRTKLEKGKELAFTSKDLARIRTDIDIILDLEKASTAHLDFKAVEKIFKELEFRMLMGRLRDLEAKKTEFGPSQQLSLFGEPVEKVGNLSNSEINTVLVDTEEGLQERVRELEKAEWLSFDTETTDTDPVSAKLVGISIAIEPTQGYYIPVGHAQSEKQLSVETVIEALKLIFKNPKIKKAGHNLKYDGMVLSHYGIEVHPNGFDSMLAAWVVDPGSFNFGLKDLADQYLNFKMTRIEELIGSGKSQLNMADVSIEKVAPYAAADAAIPLALMPFLMEQLKKNNLLKVFEEIEMPLIAVLAQMELAGIALDKGFFVKMEDELQKRLFEIETEVHQLVGYSFNINSTQQLSVALFETIGLESPNKKKTASGHYSTNAAVLEELQGKHAVVDILLEYRELSKLQSTYVKTLPEQINPQTGRVHTSFSQTGSVTGRLSSSNPNLQNIPTRTDLGRKVRNGFIALPGHGLLAVDYSQVELRIVAHMSQDEAMLAAFKANQDIHAATASAIYDVPIDKVTKEQRRHAKAINFGLIYGMSPFGLSRSTGLTLSEAENFVKAYFKRFPLVKEYLDGLRKMAMQQGYVETLLGRRRYFPNLSTTTNVNLRNREEREAINAPIQGTAADILKIAMIDLSSALQKSQLKAKILLQVHDELLLEVPENERDETMELVQSVMESAYELSIPLSTEARWGSTWGSLEVIDRKR
ncbi:MAG TPA: DNA polymerase I [Anaerolineaceae bacterium]|nr:DNA polymerase I [Anaerolineaceae bacterium]